jgi:hypothetical protein
MLLKIKKQKFHSYYDSLEDILFFLHLFAFGTAMEYHEYGDKILKIDDNVILIKLEEKHFFLKTNTFSFLPEDVATYYEKELIFFKVLYNGKVVWMNQENFLSI